MKARLVAVFLLLGLLLPSPAGAQKSSPAAELHQEDASGDVRFGPSGNNPFPGMPSSPVTDHVDLLALRVYDESIDGLRVDVKVRSLQRPPTALSGESFSVAFESATSPAARYRLQWYSYASFYPPSNGTVAFSPTFCLVVDSGPCLAQRVIGTVDRAQGILSAYLPKASLLGLDPVGRDPREAPTPVPLGPGARLVNFSATAQADLWSDRVPDTGLAGPYVFAEGFANQRIRVRAHLNETSEAPDPYYYDPYAYDAAGASDFPRISVEAGVPFALALDVENRNAAKRIVNLTTEFADSKDARFWQVRVAPSVSIPGDEERTINLVVNASPSVEHRQSALVRVVARSLGFDDEVGSITVRLVAASPPGPERPTLYLHGTKFDGGRPECTSVPQVINFCDYRAYLNTLEEDPLANADGEPLQDSGFSFSSGLTTSARYFVFGLEEDLSRDLVLDVTTPVEGEIVVGSTMGYEGSLSVELHAGDVFVGSATVPASSSQAAVPFSFLPLVESERIPAGSGIALVVRIEFTWLGPNAASLAAPPGVVPGGSSLTLPIVPDAAALSAPPRLGEAYLSLNVRGDRDEFVNPGEARAFNLTLVNEGVEEETVDVNATLDEGACALELVPGHRFRLQSGESVRFGALVYAPQDAKEGSKCAATLTATSAADPTLEARTQLRVVVTSGLDLPNDAHNYTADDEARSKLEGWDPDANTPGPGFASGLAVALLAVWRRRRARGA